MLWDLELRISEAVDSYSHALISLGNQLYHLPEVGFAEERTMNSLESALLHAGVSNYSRFPSITGLKVTLDTGKPGPTLAVLSELDAIPCAQHPDADKKTGYAHACGHHAQLTSMVGAIRGLTQSGALSHMSGKVHFFAVPAEEGVEFEHRLELKKAGKISQLTGKAEFLHRGYFDDSDMFLTLHMNCDDSVKKGEVVVEPCSVFAFNNTMNGYLYQRATFRGLASHAASSHHAGINAQDAAIGSYKRIRLIPFSDTGDCLRINPVITYVRDTLSAIPDLAVMEVGLRASSMNAMSKWGRVLDVCHKDGVECVPGSSVEIESAQVYAPFLQDPEMMRVAKKVMQRLVGEEPWKVKEYPHEFGSVDSGDISMLKPVIYPYVGGALGHFHQKDFRIVDPQMAYVLSSKFVANLAATLLGDDAALGSTIASTYKPQFATKEEYFKHVDSLARTVKYSS